MKKILIILCCFLLIFSFSVISFAEDISLSDINNYINLLNSTYDLDIDDNEYCLFTTNDNTIYVCASPTGFKYNNNYGDISLYSTSNVIYYKRVSGPTTPRTSGTSSLTMSSGLNLFYSTVDIIYKYDESVVVFQKTPTPTILDQVGEMTQGILPKMIQDLEVILPVAIGLLASLIILVILSKKFRIFLH